jgi:hypothetical protein
MPDLCLSVSLNDFWSLTVFGELDYSPLLWFHESCGVFFLRLILLVHTSFLLSKESTES